MRDVTPYQQALKRVRVRWMTGEEKGAANPRPRKPFVDIFIYNHTSWDDMLDTYTHEVVHIVHPEWEENEGAVNAVTRYLMRRSVWVQEVSQRLGQCVLETVRWMRQHKKYEVY